MFREVNMIRARKPGFESGRLISKAVLSRQLWGPGCSLGLPAPREPGVPASHRIKHNHEQPWSSTRDGLGPSQPGRHQSPAVQERGAGAQGEPRRSGGTGQ